MLHNNKDDFKELITEVANELDLLPAIVEKDYYITTFLENIVKRNSNIVFKGGTSLSKCHKIINRFSEDLDLNLSGSSKPTEGERKALKRDIVGVINELGLTLENEEDTRSKRDFNRYIISYPIEFPDTKVKPKLIVETAVFFRTYPYDSIMAGSYIYDYLANNGRGDLIDRLGLNKFEVKVQSIERTLIDKCFALADYYLSGRIEVHSRHIYDIYKLMEYIKSDERLKSLAETVRIERQSNKTCLSSADNIDLNEVLTDVLTSEAFKDDYTNITQEIFYKGENVSYTEAAKGLQEVIKSGIFIRNQETKAFNHPKEFFDKGSKKSLENSKKVGKTHTFDIDR